MSYDEIIKKYVLHNDIYDDLSTKEGNTNYTENVGSGYGRILILIDLTTLTIVFCIYVV